MKSSCHLAIKCFPKRTTTEAKPSNRSQSPFSENPEMQETSESLVQHLLYVNPSSSFASSSSLSFSSSLRGKDDLWWLTENRLAWCDAQPIKYNGQRKGILQGGSHQESRSPSSSSSSSSPPRLQHLTNLAQSSGQEAREQQQQQQQQPLLIDDILLSINEDLPKISQMEEEGSWQKEPVIGNLNSIQDGNDNVSRQVDQQEQRRQSIIGGAHPIEMGLGSFSQQSPEQRHAIEDTQVVKDETMEVSLEPEEQPGSLVSEVGLSRDEVTIGNSDLADVERGDLANSTQGVQESSPESKLSKADKVSGSNASFRKVRRQRFKQDKAVTTQREKSQDYQKTRGILAALSLPTQYVTTSVSPSSLGIAESTIDDSLLPVLYSWVRCQLVAGRITQVCGFVHNLIRQGYQKAQQQLVGRRRLRDQKIDDQKLLLELRNRLAGLWCLLAHLLIQFPAQDFGIHTKGTLHQSNEKPDSNLDIVRAFAIHILLVAGSCPLVGTHPWVVVALGRLLVSSSAFHHAIARSSSTDPMLEGPNTTVMNGSQLRSLLRLAISACWDGVDRCRRRAHNAVEGKTNGTLLSPRRISVSCGELAQIKSIKYLLSIDQQGAQNRAKQNPAIDLEKSFVHVLGLPQQMNLLESDHPILRLPEQCHRNAIHTLCQELNHWSRLEECLEKHPTLIMEASCSSSSLECLPLFRGVQRVASSTIMIEKQRQRGQELPSKTACEDIIHACKICRSTFAHKVDLKLHERYSNCRASWGSFFESVVVWKW